MSRNDESGTGLQALAKLGGYVSLALGVLTIFITAYIAVRVYSPVWFADDWQIPMDYMTMGGHYPLAKFWAQHNEHRVPFVTAMFFFDLFYLHGNHAFLIAVNYFFQVAEWLAFTFFLKRLFDWTRAEFFTGVGVAAFLIVNPNQMQNVEFAFTSFFTVYAFSIVSLGSLSAFKSGKRLLWIALAIAGAFLAEFSGLASGILVPVMLPIAAYLLGFSLRRTGVLAAVAVFGVVIYLVGYQSPSNATKPLDALTHPGQVIGFLLAFFGESWHYILPEVGSGLAALAILAVCGFLVWALMKRSAEPGEIFLLALALVCLASGLLTAMGRQVNGVGQSREGRYQTPAMLFWCCIAIFALWGLRKLGSNRVVGLLGLQAVFCFLCLAETVHLSDIYQLHQTSGYIRDTAGAALESGVDALDRIRMIYPGPASVPPTYSYMVNRGLMTPPLGMQSLMGVALASRFHTVPVGNCVGATGSVTVIGTKNGRKELYAEGWASQTGLDPFPKVVSVSEDGVINGLGVSGGERPDVIKVIPQVTSLNSGWNLYALVPLTAKTLTIYGLVPGTDLVCEIPYSKPIPQ